MAAQFYGIHREYEHRAVRLSVSRILVRDLRRHLSWEYRSQLEVSAVTFLALNINRTKKSQELPARSSPKRRPRACCQKFIRGIMVPRSSTRMIPQLCSLYRIK